MQEFAARTNLFVLILILCVVGAPGPALAEGTPFAQNDPRALRLQAFQRYIDGDYEGSRAGYEQAIQAGKQKYGADSSFVADLYYEVGSISLEDGQFQVAEKFLKLAVDHKPCSVVARVKYADVLNMRGQSDQALHQIELALKRDPRNPIAQQARARWMMTQASPKNKTGAAANVAATWECFRLHLLGKESVQQTLASLDRHRIQNGKGSTLAMMRTRSSKAEPKVETKQEETKTEEPVAGKKEEAVSTAVAGAQSPAPDGQSRISEAAPTSALTSLHSRKTHKKEIEESAPPAKSKAKRQKPVEQPRVAKTQAKKTKPSVDTTEAAEHVARKQPAAKPVEHNDEEETKVSEHVAEKPVKQTREKKREEHKEVVASIPKSPGGKRSKGGLVPPPPPSVPVFGAPPVFVSAPPPPTGFAEVRLQTKAEKVGAREEKKKKAKPQPDVEQEPDFLIDWGGVDGKRKKP